MNPAPRALGPATDAWATRELQRPRSSDVLLEFRHLPARSKVFLKIFTLLPESNYFYEK